MAIRIRYKLSVGFSSSQAEENDLGYPKYEVVTDSPSEGGAWKTTLDASTTMALNLDDITTAGFLMLRFTPKDPTQVMTPVSVTLNGATPALSVQPLGGATEAIFMITAPITTVSLANLDPASVPLDVVVGVAGD